ncbi:MAG: hypothetical protein COB41_07240 [Proteobacteria bacterium]|nr:MAG: hypothetical protein COB41_07240 [Pseudomonadota bacterium]
MRMNEIKIVEQLDRGLAYAEACFETFRVFDGCVFQQAEHQQRLQYGLKSYGFSCADEDVNSWFEQAMSAASIQGNDILVRLTVSAGDADWGLLHKADERSSDVHVQVQMILPIKPIPAHLKTVRWPFPLREKKAKYTSDYAESLRAIQQWRCSEEKLDAPMQALICASDGNLLSTLTGNIMIYRHGQWHTPVGDGILSGVIQQFLLRNKLLVACECPVLWLDDCEAIALSNSGIFVRAAHSVNSRALDVSGSSFSIFVDALKGCKGVPEF